ncbi:hypothetical protein PVAND_009097 [Polypedilum vanderplanki]|uniref:ISXO2-like transposase domain-containing protein n=1 Tax=Polypedilum vanderplanki TaxID=319348 RepID=A0A9J6CBL1_POLVA|nr:hypothetical protein PVAND_009097 [Polypedilum vanderplanki]
MNWFIEIKLVVSVAKDGDNFRWRCYNTVRISKKAPKKCNYSRSLTSGTFFSSHLSIVDICKFLVLWVQNASLLVIKNETEITAQKTLVDWSSMSREVLFDAFILNAKPLGGIGRTIEIDESKFGRRKYNRGKRVEGQWIFGLLERETGDIILVPVEKRDRDTLIPIIQKYVLPGSTIISDFWKSYDTLNDLGYQHLKVNHSITFKDPETGANTNRIESTWRAAKASYSSSGRRKSFYASYLAKYIFMKKCRSLELDPFLEFLRLAGKLYDATNYFDTPLEPAVDESDDDDDDETEELQIY